jgi:NADPH-dependent ferric siderophore reductase
MNGSSLMALSFHTSVADTSERHVFQRVRHELKRRWATVLRRESLGGDMLRLTFGGTDLADFASPAFDDHIKLFLPADGALIRSVPVESLVGRHYTPRRYNATTGELAIDFYLHETGVITTWATRAQSGDEIVIGGPRGSTLPPDDFDWYLLAGDETALPAIARRLEELPAGKTVIALVEVARPGAEIPLPSNAALTLVWVYRENASDSLADSLASLQLPDGEGYAWVASEAGAARAARQVLIEQHGLPREWVKAAGYWKRGESDQHVKLDD